MEPVGQTTFWTVFTLIISSIGAVLMFFMSHAAEPKHAQAASSLRVSQLEVKSERVSANVENNARVLEELKLDVKELRTEQRESAREILNAINDR